MREAFENLSHEKQVRILNAAFAEFTEYGYKHASTNRIVEAAGIGKGMLFYYFGNKQGLYDFLVDYSIAYLEEYLLKLNEMEKDCDFIEQYKLASKQKWEAYLKNPHVFEFMTRLYFNKDEITSTDKIRKRYFNLEFMKEQILNDFNINTKTSKFRTDIDTEKLIKYFRWNINGYTQELTAYFKGKKLADIDLEPYWKEFDEYMDDLKKLFYV